MRYLRTEKLRSFHLRPFIVLTITKRAHYKAESEAACRVSVLKLVSPTNRTRNSYGANRLPNQTHELGFGLGFGFGFGLRLRFEDISARTRSYQWIAP